MIIILVYKNLHQICMPCGKNKWAWLVSTRAMSSSRALKSSVDFSYSRNKAGLSSGKKNADISLLAWIHWLFIRLTYAGKTSVNFFTWHNDVMPRPR